MQILLFQPGIAERMLAGTDGETIYRDSAFVQTTNNYWLAQHDDIATPLAPDNPPNTPCFQVEGAQNLVELIALVESGGFDEVEEFDGDDDSQHEAAIGCSGHGHDGHRGCSHW